MPLYDFKCSKCEHEYELKVSYEEKDVQSCPECGSPAPQVWNKQGPGLGDPIRLGLVKPPDAFRDRLREIDKTTPGSQLRYNSSYI